MTSLSKKHSCSKNCEENRRDVLLSRHVALTKSILLFLKIIFSLLLKIFFPKVINQSINQSINHFIYVNTWWDGVAPIIQAEGSCVEHIYDKAYNGFSLPFPFLQQTTLPTIKFVLMAFIEGLLFALTSRLP